MIGAIPFPQFDSAVFRIRFSETFEFALHWYAVAYLMAFVIGYVGLRWMAQRRWVQVAPQAVADLITVLATGVILGGRLGWWLFYHRPAPGTADPWYEPIAIWHGGMSFHGGLVGVVIALIAWCRWNKIPFWNLADALALVTPVGLFFGRIANFIRPELVGRPTDVPWAVNFPGYAHPRHPSQLYEAFLEGILLLTILWLVRLTRQPREGRLAALFVIFYGLFRFAVEFTREPDEQLGYIAFGWLTMGQLLSLGMVAAGFAMWWFAGKRRSSAPAATPSSVSQVRTK